MAFQQASRLVFPSLTLILERLKGCLCILVQMQEKGAYYRVRRWPVLQDPFI